MNPNVISILDRCIRLTNSLQSSMAQDSAEMEECTRGPLLAVYRDAMEKGVQMARAMEWDLRELYDEEQIKP